MNITGTKADIIEFVRQHKDGVNFGQIKDHIGFSKTAIANHLRDLISSGHLSTEGLPAQLTYFLGPQQMRNTINQQFMDTVLSQSDAQGIPEEVKKAVLGDLQARIKNPPKPKQSIVTKGVPETSQAVGGSTGAPKGVPEASQAASRSTGALKGVPETSQAVGGSTGAPKGVPEISQAVGGSAGAPKGVPKSSQAVSGGTGAPKGVPESSQAESGAIGVPKGVPEIALATSDSNGIAGGNNDTADKLAKTLHDLEFGIDILDTDLTVSQRFGKFKLRSITSELKRLQAAVDSIKTDLNNLKTTVNAELGSIRASIEVLANQTKLANPPTGAPVNNVTYAQTTAKSKGRPISNFEIVFRRMLGIFVFGSMIYFIVRAIWWVISSIFEIIYGIIYHWRG